MEEVSSVTVALVNDYEVVVRGLAQMFSGDDRFRVIELEAGGLPEAPVHVALYDTFGTSPHHERLTQLSELPHVGRVVAYSWDADPNHVNRVLDAGADGFVSKTLGAEELLDALLRAHAGERVVEVGSGGQPRTAASPGEVTDEVSADEPHPGDWPGRAFGLTYREAEVVALVSDALTNAEIADRLFLSINSVKSHIRSAYRKMEVERRSQAVRWAHANGLARPVAPTDLEPSVPAMNGNSA